MRYNAFKSISFLAGLRRCSNNDSPDSQEKRIATAESTWTDIDRTKGKGKKIIIKVIMNTEEKKKI